MNQRSYFFIVLNFWQYLFSKHFTVWIDQKNVVGFQKLKSDSHVFNRIKTKLIGYDFNVIYKQGIFNMAVDFLSRHPVGIDDSTQLIV